jgi:hypothetical protein
MMQLMMPSPKKAARHARKASPSSERRTGTAAIKPDLSNEGAKPNSHEIPMAYDHKMISIFCSTSYSYKAGLTQNVAATYGRPSPKGNEIRKKRVEKSARRVALRSSTRVDRRPQPPW